MQPLELIFIFSWWVFLVIYGMMGSGYLAIPWTLLGLLYFVFHPDKFQKNAKLIPWNNLTAFYLFEIISSGLIFSGFLTFLVLDLGTRNELVLRHSYENYVLIAIGFLFLSMLALTGPIIFLFQNIHSAKFHIATALAVLIPSIVAAVAHDWIFEGAIEKFQHSVHIKFLIFGVCSIFIYTTISIAKKLYEKYPCHRCEIIYSCLRNCICNIRKTIINLFSLMRNFLRLENFNDH
jgi:hypothetical protein